MTVKIQHYVPQFYLKSFSFKRNGNHLVNCFDKTSEKQFRTATRNVACEKYFYDGSLDQPTEKYLSAKESQFASVHKKLMQAGNLNVLTDDEKRIFSGFIAIQLLRTKHSRDQLVNIEKTLKTELLKRSGIEEGKIVDLIEIDNEEIKELHNDILIDDLTDYIESILSLGWVLLINKTSQPFWTSDNPVNMDNIFTFGPLGSLGLKKPGINVYLPLSPEICLMLCDPDLLSFLLKLPETIFELSKVIPASEITVPHIISKDLIIIDNTDNITYINHLQVKWSTRHVFSTENDFSLAREMISKNPELKLG